MYNLNLYEFGIYLELTPDEEEKQMLEQNIQASIQQGSIDLEDAIELREIKNLKLANQVLKFKRKQKAAADKEAQLAQIEAQANAQAETAERTAMAEVQKRQAIAETELQIEQGKNTFAIKKMEQEAVIKRQLMEMQHKFDLELKQMEVDRMVEKERLIEDRKDERTRLEGTQQSQMIEQRKNNTAPLIFGEEQTEANIFNNSLIK